MYTQFMRASILFVAIAALVSCGFYFFRCSTTTGYLDESARAKTARSPIMGQEASNADKPSLDLGNGDLSSRMAVVPTFLVGSPGDEKKRLESGELHLRSGSVQKTMPIQDGRCVLDASFLSQGWTVGKVVATEQEIVFAAPIPLDATGLTCFGYPGYFLNAQIVDGGTSSLWVYNWSPMTATSTRGKYPTRLEELQLVKVEAGGLWYVPQLPQQDGVFFARAEGTAWALFSTEGFEAGEVIPLSLVAGGGAAFSIVGRLGSVPLRLVVRDGGGALSMTAPWSSLTTGAVDGLPTGAYTAYLVHREETSRGSAITPEVPFTVESGKVSSVEFGPIGITPAVEVVGRLAGVLEIEAWELVKPWFEAFRVTLVVEEAGLPQSRAFKQLTPGQRRMTISRMEQVVPEASGAPVWRWDFGEYPTGSYRLMLEPLQFSTVVEVTPVAVEHRIRVPEMAVTVLDFGIPVDDPSSVGLLCHPLKSQPSQSITPSPKLLAESDGTVKMISSPGAYVLAVVWDGCVHEKEVELESGWNYVYHPVEDLEVAEIRFTNSAGLPLSLTKDLWDGVTVTSPAGAAVRFEVIHVQRRRVSGYSRLRIHLKGAGTYTLRGLPIRELRELEVALKDGDESVVRCDG